MSSRGKFRSWNFHFIFCNKTKSTARIRANENGHRDNSKDIDTRNTQLLIQNLGSYLKTEFTRIPESLRRISVGERWKKVGRNGDGKHDIVLDMEKTSYVTRTTPASRIEKEHGKITSRTNCKRG